MSRHTIATVFLLLPLLAFCFAPATWAVDVVNEPPTDLAHTTKALSGDPFTELDADAAVNEIYRRFADLSAASGQEIRFEISNLQSHRSGQFDSLLWLDLFTEPGGPTVETIPHSRIAELPSNEAFSLVSSWEDVDGSAWHEQAFLKEAAPLRAHQALGRLVEYERDRLAGVTGLSTFEVEVTFEERSRSYRALVLWKPVDADTLLFTLVDHVVPEVAQAYHESRQVITADEMLTAPSPEVAQRQEKATICPSSSNDQIDPTISTGALTIGHSSGQHNASLRAARTCTLGGCSSTCTPYSASKACNEFGSTSNPLVWHKRSNSVKVSSINGSGTQSSQCGYAWGCAVKSCPLGICSGVSFGIAGSGASLTITATSSVLSDMSLSKGGSCPPGEIDFDPPTCEEMSSGVATLSLSGGGVKSSLPASDFQLSRLEPSEVVHDGQQISYLMGEWALLGHERAPGKAAAVRTVSTSNEDFAIAKQAEMENLLANSRATKASRGEELTLVVALPPHEANSRHIHMPELKVRPTPVLGGTPERKILVRADFAEDHSLQGLRFLHDSSGGVPHDLALKIEQALSLESQHAGEHRVVAFALISVGRTLELDAVIPYLPKCCCGVTFCV